MLVSLRIRNLALVEELELELEPGYNAVTGETGAGKSILIGALELALGERAARDAIRTGAESCSVEAVFEAGCVPALAETLEEIGAEPCEDGRLLVKRAFSAAGANRQFVNGSPVTLQSLTRLGELLVDLHGPHDHQSLLKTEAQLRILDRFAGIEEARATFAATLGEIRAIEARKRELAMDDKEFARQLDLVAHQVKEIEAARLQPGEEEQLEADYKVASSSQKLLELSAHALDAVSEGEGSATVALARAERALRDLAATDPAAAALEEANRAASVQVQDLARELSRYSGKLDPDPERLQKLSERMTVVQTLKRKYGKTLAEVIAFGAEAKARLKILQGRSAELARIDTELDQVRATLRKSGEGLRAARKKAAPSLCARIESQLRELGFAQAKFAAELAPAEPTVLGMDALEFRVSPNVGEPLKALRDIASSGEMARVMLALKTALADQDEVPVLVFDEVDANVGGEVGHRVGEKMARIGKRHQVLCVTHLPQVAACAKTHLSVTKRVEKGRTFTRVERLDRSAREKELARMLGGAAETALRHAREMLRAASD
ncbi:MAG: DNA repair protein RecN [Verrucomicrobiae bacterium]|nr:DNA repair protein RecN [Verrucomicrobiae bacterium]